MLSKREKQALRDEAMATEVVMVDGVMVGVPKALKGAEREQFLAAAAAEMGDPASEFAIAKQRRTLARERFDKRRDSLREAIAKEAERKGDSQGGIDRTNAGA